MLPDFPKIKKYILSDFEEKVREKTYAVGSILSEIGERLLHEGASSRIRNQAADFEDTTRLERIEQLFEIRTVDLIEKGVSAYYEKINDLACRFAESHEKMLFKKIEQVTEENNMMVDCKDKSFSEGILELIGKMDIDFNSKGEPLFNFIIHPSLSGKIRQLECDVIFCEKWKTILNKKKQEFNERTADRKLVD